MGVEFTLSPDRGDDVGVAHGNYKGRSNEHRSGDQSHV